jgi:hypothetical protein
MQTPTRTDPNPIARLLSALATDCPTTGQHPLIAAPLSIYNLHKIRNLPHSPRWNRNCTLQRTTI